MRRRRWRWRCSETCPPPEQQPRPRGCEPRQSIQNETALGADACGAQTRGRVGAWARAPRFANQTAKPTIQTEWGFVGTGTGVRARAPNIMRFSLQDCCGQDCCGHVRSEHPEPRDAVDDKHHACGRPVQGGVGVLRTSRLLLLFGSELKPFLIFIAVHPRPAAASSFAPKLFRKKKRPPKALLSPPACEQLDQTTRCRCSRVYWQRRATIGVLWGAHWF